MSVGQRHDPDRELLGQGLANIASPLVGGIPATAAIARTAVNVRAGATSRLAALAHAVLLLGVVLLAARGVGEIPLAALAGVLLATAVQMVRVSSLAALVRSTRGDAATMILTAAATVVFDLVLAVIIGRLERRGVPVLLSGVRPGHARVLTELGVYERLAHERHLFATTPEAITHARLHAARVDHTADGAAISGPRSSRPSAGSAQ